VCVTGKREYRFASEAILAAERQRHRVYRCQHCGLWHTTKDARPENFSKVNKLPLRAVERIWDLYG
jgi:DNA-directed RNA polymerase subunit RPC12/RpoP